MIKYLNFMSLNSKFYLKILLNDFCFLFRNLVYLRISLAVDGAADENLYFPLVETKIQCFFFKKAFLNLQEKDENLMQHVQYTY